MSTTPTEPVPTEPTEPQEEYISPEENRRLVGIQVGAQLATQRGEGIDNLLRYAKAVERFIEDGSIDAMTEPEPGPINPR